MTDFGTLTAVSDATLQISGFGEVLFPSETTYPSATTYPGPDGIYLALTPLSDTALTLTAV